MAVGAVSFIGLTVGGPAVASAAPTITRYAGTGAAASPIAGLATSSPLRGPQATTLDSAGNLYIVDTLNQRVEKVTPDGTLSMFAGNGTRGAAVPGPATSSPLNYPQGIAIDADDNVYIADTANNRIEKVTPSGTLSFVAGDGTQGPATDGPASASPLDQPMGVAAGPDGTVYIADTLSYTIAKVTTGGTLSIIAGNGLRGNPTPGPARLSRLSDPEAVSVDDAGNVYITDTAANVIEKVTPGGTLSVFAGTGARSVPTPGPAASSALDSPEGFAIDAAGNTFIADCGNNVVEKVDTSGTLSIVAGDGTSGAPSYGATATASPINCAFGVTVAPSGTLYVTDINNHTIDRVGLDTPGAPIRLDATEGDGTAELVFAPPTDPGTSPVSGYEISLDNGATWTTLTTSPGPDGSLTASLTGLSNARTYDVQIRARNGAGAGLASVSLTVTPHTSTPTPPDHSPTATPTPTPTKPSAGTPTPALTTMPPAPITPAAPAAPAVCVSQRTVTVHFRVAPGAKLRSLRVSQTGKATRALSRTTRRAVVDMRGYAAGTVRVRLRARTKDGRRLTAVRTYRTCAASATRTTPNTLYLRAAKR